MLDPLGADNLKVMSHSLSTESHCFAKSHPAENALPDPSFKPDLGPAEAAAGNLVDMATVTLSGEEQNLQVLDSNPTDLKIGSKETLNLQSEIDQIVDSPTDPPN